MEIIVRNPGRTATTETEVHVELAYADNGVSPDQSILTVQPAIPKIRPGSGTVAFQFKLSNISDGPKIENDPRKYVLYVQPARPPQLNGGASFDMVKSTPFKCIRHRLVITQQPEEKFYKDYGGQGNFLHIKAHLEDAHGKVVLNREVPLSVKLAYHDSPESVFPFQNDKSILNLITPNPRLAQGQADIKARIESVSRNHQKKSFVFRILPDPAQRIHDIGMCTSSRVFVLSKKTVSRAKRQKRPRGGGGGSDRKLMQYIPTGSSIAATFDPETTPFGAVHEWCNSTFKMLTDMEWRIVTFENFSNGNHICLTRPIFRCPGCWAYADYRDRLMKQCTHKDNCPLARAIANFQSAVKPTLDDIVTRSQSGGENSNKRKAPASSSSSTTPPFKKERLPARTQPSSASNPMLMPNSPAAPVSSVSLPPGLQLQPSLQPSFSLTSLNKPTLSLHDTLNGWDPLGDPFGGSFGNQGEDEAEYHDHPQFAPLVPQTPQIMFTMPYDADFGGFPAFNKDQKFVGVLMYQGDKLELQFMSYTQEILQRLQTKFQTLLREGKVLRKPHDTRESTFYDTVMSRHQSFPS